MRQKRSPLLETPASIFLVFFVQAFLVLCLFLSLVYGVAELTLFSMLLLAIGLGSRLWSRISLKHVRCRIRLNHARVFPGERLKIGIRVVNAKFVPILVNINLFIPETVSGEQSGQWIREEGGLLWFQQITYDRVFFPSRRGVFNLGPPRVRTGDLFGFFPRYQALAETTELIVYPRIAAIRPLVFPRRDFFGVPGARNPVEDPAFVFGTRDYMPGRPARGIHWKASARHNRLQEKLCEPAEHEKVLLVLDTDGFDTPGAGGLFEQTLEVMAALVLQMARQGIAMGFATNGHVIGGKSGVLPILAGSFQAADVMEILARIDAEKAGPPIIEILSKGCTLPWGVSCICFVRDGKAPLLSVRTFMRNRGVPVRFVVSQAPDAVETTGPMPEADGLYLEDILIPETQT